MGIKIASFFFFFFPYILLLITTPVHSEYYSQSVPYNPAQLMKTNLRFFLHDTLSGANPTAVRIAGPNATEHNPIPFGALLAMDDAITEGPEPTSKVIGNARGMYLSASKGEDVTLVLYADFGFTRGKFKGSSFSVFSRNPVMESRRELAVVGGRGLFRMASGTARVTSHSMDVSTGDAILEYDVEIVYPSGLGFVDELFEI